MIRQIDRCRLGACGTKINRQPMATGQFIGDYNIHIAWKAIFTLNRRKNDTLLSSSYYHQDLDIERLRYRHVQHDSSIRAYWKLRVDDVFPHRSSPVDRRFPPVQNEHSWFGSSPGRQCNRRNIYRRRTLVIRIATGQYETGSVGWKKSSTLQTVVAECHFGESILSIGLSNRLNGRSIIDQRHFEAICRSKSISACKV